MSDIWKMTQLGAVADITMGQSPDSSFCNTDEIGMPFLQGCAEFGTRHPKPEVHCAPPLRVAKRDSILISVRAPVGQMNWSDQEYCIGRGLGSIKAKAGIASTYFLKHALGQNIQFLHRRSQGSTFLAIGANDLKLFPIPDISERKQGKIAFILETTAQAIEQTESLIHKYQQIKAGLMHDMFTRGLTADGKLRPPREQAPELYQETPIGWIPKEWGVAYLDDEIRIIDCKHYTPNYCEEGYPVVRPRNVHDDGLDFSNIDFVSRKDFLSLTDTHQPSIGDIVFSRNASFGIPCYVEDDLEFAIGQDVVIMVEKLANTRFVFYTLKSNIIIKQISRLFSGSTFGRINLGDIRKLKIPTPRHEEQERIAFRLMVNDNRINQEKRNKSKLIKLKSGLMHDLLTGKVLVTIDQAETTYV